MITQELKDQIDRTRKRELSVLFAEDNETVREALTKSLKMVFKKVVAVEDGRAALEALRYDRFDFIITDINMPNTDGSRLIRAIRKFCKTFPIIITTAHSEFKDIYKETPNIVVITKPCSIINIMEAIDEFERHHNVISDDVYEKLNNAYDEARKVLDLLNKSFKGK